MTPKDYATMIICAIFILSVLIVGAAVFIRSGQLSNLEDLGDGLLENEELED